MTHYFTPDKIEGFKTTFKIFDKDGDGTISCNGLADVMRIMGQNPTEKEVKALVDEVDANGNGKIDFSEFLELMEKHYGEEDQEEELKEAFKVFNRNGDGFITTRELKYMMTNLGESLTDEQITEMLREADINGAGKIDYDEFVKMMTNPCV